MKVSVKKAFEKDIEKITDKKLVIQVSDALKDWKSVRTFLN